MGLLCVLSYVLVFECLLLSSDFAFLLLCRSFFFFCCCYCFVLYSCITVKLQITKTLCTIIEMTFVAEAMCCLSLFFLSLSLCMCVYHRAYVRAFIRVSAVVIFRWSQFCKSNPYQELLTNAAYFFFFAFLSFHLIFYLCVQWTVYMYAWVYGC